MTQDQSEISDKFEEPFGSELAGLFLFETILICAFSLVTSESEGMLSIKNTLPPIVDRAPILVSPPRIVALG